MCSDHKKSHIRQESDLIASTSPLKGSKYIFVSSYILLSASSSVYYILHFTFDVHFQLYKKINKIKLIILHFLSHISVRRKVKIKNKIEKIYAKKELILSGGSINSPQLLMLSGIGDADHLKDKGIKVINMEIFRNENLIGYSNYFFTHGKNTLEVKNYTQFNEEEF